MTLDEKIKSIAKHYGLEHQKFKLLEEASELIAAEFQQRKAYLDLYLKNLSAGEQPKGYLEACNKNIDKAEKHFEEEFADILVVAKTIEYLLTNPLNKEFAERINETMEAKVNRQITRIEEEEEESYARQC